ncbi:hypothetical protein HCI99_13080 [Listeria booriae]|uniref:Uncharacterized protein n=1 Tax=Listeria booriae TaxID=1552123 RepID=A0A7X1CCS1_9LIST|nr:hypothetical protein [Listeria booriae]MBC1492751.1 hypothetical protein [Listeria booriae]
MIDFILSNIIFITGMTLALLVLIFLIDITMSSLLERRRTRIKVFDNHDYLTYVLFRKITNYLLILGITTFIGFNFWFINKLINPEYNGESVVNQTISREFPNYDKITSDDKRADTYFVYENGNQYMVILSDNHKTIVYQKLSKKEED